MPICWKPLWVLLALASASFMPGGAAGAAEVVDQDALVAPPPPGFVALSYRSGQFEGLSYTVGQTITAGSTGLLTRIELQAFKPQQVAADSAYFELIDGDLDGAWVSIWGPGRDLPITDFANFTEPGALSSIDVSSLRYRVQPGQKFGFLLTMVSGPQSNLAFRIGDISFPPGGGAPLRRYNNYGGGAAYHFSWGQRVALAGDIGFRTFVDASAVGAVPEPSTWAMMLVGFGTLGAVMRGHARRGGPGAPSRA